MAISRLVAALCCLLFAPTALAQPPQPVPAVAVQQAAVEDAGHGPITVGIWYPAGAVAGEGASRVAGSGLALVIISHGTGGAPLSHIDTARALAEGGFVVVAPMHPGDNFQDQSIVGRPQWLAERSRHISRIIDFMLTRWAGHAQLNPRRIGVFGFSAGATTALIAAGGTPDLSLVATHCAQRPEFVCQLMAPAGAETPAFVHDGRIAAVVAAAPGLGFTFEPAGLAQVRVPVQLWVGGADETVPFATNGAVVRRLLPDQPDFREVENAVHLSFLAPCTAETPPMLCQDRPGFDRAAFHRSFNQAVAAFFRQHLTAE